MNLLKYLPVLLGLLIGSPSLAQVTDNFSDGDFTQNPVWTGTTERWTVTTVDGDPALRTNGLTESDTLYLATPSTVSRGIWSFSFDWRGVNLSNFNGARIFLAADRQDLMGAVQGYYLQLGTNNSDEVRLYRQDGDPGISSNRVLIGRSDDSLLAGDTGTITLEINRSDRNEWTVSADGAEIIATTDATYQDSQFFGTWVKHTRSGAQSYFFDDFVVMGDAGPADIIPPEVTGAAYSADLPGFSVDFSETIDATSVTTDAFAIDASGVGVPFTLVTGSSVSFDSATLLLDTPLSGGTYLVFIKDLTDFAANVIADTSLTFNVVSDSDPPMLVQVSALDTERVRVVFDEGVGGCTPSLYSISNGIGVPDAIEACIPEGGQAEYVLLLGRPLQPGTTYTLTVQNIADEAGNVLVEASKTFTFVQATDAPDPGDIVINEIMYDPPTTNLEYIELLNLTDETCDLSALLLADSRLSPVPITDAPATLEPNSYAVLVRDGAAFSQVFPGVSFLEVQHWPALNNSGDTAVLLSDEIVLDSVAFLPGWGGDGVSLERIDPTGSSNSASNYGSSVDPRGGTPGAENSIFSVDMTPPQPISVAPSRDGTLLTVTFSEPISPSSIISTGFFLLPANAPVVTDATPGSSPAIVLVQLEPALSAGNYTLVVQGVRDRSGNTLDVARVVFSFFMANQPGPRDIVVNEIMYDPSTSDEYVEFFNRSDESFDLSQFMFADGSTIVPISSAPVLLPPGGYAVIVRDGDSFTQAFPGIAFTEPPGWPTLNNAGDTVALLFAGMTIDSVAYEPSWGGSNVSLERIDPAGASNSRFNFGSSVDLGGGTPGAQNSIFAPDTLPPMPVFAEQVFEDAIEIFFSEFVDPSTITSSAFTLDDGRGPSQTVIQDENTSVLLRFGGHISGPHLTVQNISDAAGNTLGTAAVRIAYRAMPGEIIINEIMYEPRSDTLAVQPEYVELRNNTARALSLRNLYWTDEPNAGGEADTLRFGDEFNLILPDSFAVVFADPDPTGKPAIASTLADGFPETDFSAGEVALLTIEARSLSLRNSDDLIQLHRPDDVILDAVYYNSDWHNPSLRDATGISLERISPTAGSHNEHNWTSSVAEAGGTPGRSNTVFLSPSAAPRADTGIDISPSPFSPDGDGMEDQTAIRYTLDATASLVRVRIFDARGRHVRTLEDALLAGRTGELIWDGLNDEGNPLRVGIYVVLFEAINTEAGTTKAFKKPVVLARPL